MKKEWLWMDDYEEDYLDNIDKKTSKTKIKKLRKDRDANEEDSKNYDNLLDDLWNTENKIKVDGHWYIRMSNAISISYKYNTKNKKDK